MALKVRVVVVVKVERREEVEPKVKVKEDGRRSRGIRIRRCQRGTCGAGGVLRGTNVNALGVSEGCSSPPYA